MSEKSILPAEVVERILKARDALVMHDRDEAYHQLYAIASPKFDKYFPWDEMEKQINYPRFNDEEIKSRKEFDSKHFKPQGQVWVKASERLPEQQVQLHLKIEGTKSIGYFNKIQNAFIDDSGDTFAPFYVEWLCESPAEQPVGELEQLRRWKMEAAELLTKINSYAHKHLEIKLGECAVEFVINRCKELDRINKAHEQPVREVDKEIIDAQAEYIQLLGDELNEVVGLVATRGYWQSTRVEQGKQIRQKIDELYNLKDQKEK